MKVAVKFRSKRRRFPISEILEDRVLLTGDCQIDAADLPQNDATRAVYAVNCFALDLYEHYRPEQGNLFLSPLSISTALAMVYAGAAGETANEMAQTLHLGSEPGIHEAYSSLLTTLTSQPNYELTLANAQWPQAGFLIKQAFAELIESQYDGYTEALDYAGDVELARETINDWVEQSTDGHIKELIERLSPSTVMVLTNAILFNGLWQMPFDPNQTRNASFTLEDGSNRSVSMMFQPACPTFPADPLDPFGGPSNEPIGYAYSEQGDFRVLEMPYEGQQTSMVILLPKDGKTTDDLTPETMANVERWLNSSPTRITDIDVAVPKFKTTVSSKLEQLLPDMGMPRAFGNADFSNMTDAAVSIDQVGHKAFIENNEQGTKAAAATFVSFVLCFAKGTPVLTPDGEKPIELIEPGDLVMSRDEHDVEGQVEAMPVEKTFHGRAELLELRIEGQRIRSTTEHPFFVRDRGWTKAGDLQPGDMLSSDLGSWVQLQGVKTLEGTHDVYNFRVKKHHTYFVGGSDFGFAVWTHNCYDAVNYTVDRPFHFYIRDNSTSAMLFMGRISDPTDEAENKLTPMVASNTSQLPGDADGSGEVNFADFLIMSNNFGKEQDAVFAEGDFDRNGAIDFADFLILSANFGKEAPVEA